jgi:hypothetical protein
MPNPRCFKYLPCLSLLMLFATLVVTTTAFSATHGLPPAFGKLCGHVSGASWTFQGQTGIRYNVVALPTGSCAVAMKSVTALSKQKPHAGAVGSQTLSGPKGFQCAGSGIKLAHAGFCGSGHAKFMWAPQVKQ